MKHTKKLVICAMFAALCTVVTFIHLPIPGGGYVNPGDVLVLLGAFVLGGWYGFAAGAIGSALADVLLTYALYAPGTFVIKGIMALTAAYFYHCGNKMQKKSFALIWIGIGTILGELIMVGGYFLYEFFFLGLGTGALASVIGNTMQGLVCAVLSVILIYAFKTNHALIAITRKLSD